MNPTLTVSADLAMRKPEQDADESSRQIEAELVGLLYKQAPSGFVATLINAGIVTFMLWPSVSHSVLLIWLILIVVVTAARFALVLHYRRSASVDTLTEYWRSRFIVGAGAAGTVWGAAGIVLFSPDSLIAQVLLVLMLGGMAAGGVVSLAPIRGAFFAFFLPTLLPITVRLLFSGEMSSMSLPMLAFAGVLLEMERRMHVAIVESLRLRFAHLTASQKVQVSEARNTANEVARQELEKEIVDRQRMEKQLKREIEQRRQAEEHLRRSLTRLQVLAETSQAFAEVGVEVQPLLDRVVQKIVETLSDACHLYLLSDDEKSMYLSAVAAAEPEASAVIRELAPVQLRMDEPGLTSKVQHSGQAIFLPIINMDDLRASINPQRSLWVERYKPHSGIIVPLRTQGRGIGVLLLGRYRQEQVAFTEEDLHLAQDLADRAALAITNGWLYHNLQAELVERRRAEERMQQQLGRLALLHELTRAIGGRQDLSSIFLTVLGRLESELPVAFAAVLVGHAHDPEVQVHTLGPASRALAREMGLTPQAALPVERNGLQRPLAGQTVYEPDTLQVPFSFPQHLAQVGLRALVCTPLEAKTEVFGFLVVARREVGSFSSGECEFLRQVSEHVALAVRQVQLSTEVQQAYDELRQTQHLLVQQERLRAVGQLASGIAHDINNAITPAALYMEDVLLHEEALSAEGRDSLTTVQTAIRDVAQTVARLREFHRQADMAEEQLPVDLNHIVQQSVDLTRARWRDQAQQQGIEIRLETQLGAGLPMVAGNEGEIRELLINLILNAVDAMPQGGRLRLVTQARPMEVVVEVVDGGVGMDAETRERCMEPFYTTKGERGTGLGLAMVYGIVQRHRGCLEIESEVGQGTTMRVVFPVGEEGEGVPVVVGGEKREVGALRILVIDDEPLIRKSMGEILQRWGHEVVTASSGEEGVGMFRAAGEAVGGIDVVITDLGMPKMDGMEVARRIKEVKEQTPVIMLTGWGQQLSATAEKRLHVDMLLSKPPQLAELRAALETVTSRG